MNCQAYVRHRPYSHPGQCESRHHIKELVVNGKRVRGLCGTHRRSESLKKLRLITDPTLKLEEVL